MIWYGMGMARAAFFSFVPSALSADHHRTEESIDMPSPLTEPSPPTIAPSADSMKKIMAAQQSDSSPTSPPPKHDQAPDDNNNDDDVDVSMIEDDTDTANASEPSSSVDNGNAAVHERTKKEESAMMATMEDDLESSAPTPPSEAQQSSIPTVSSSPSNANDKRTEPEEEVMTTLDEIMEKERNNAKVRNNIAPISSEQKRRSEDHLDETLDKLQHSISVAILAFRKDEERRTTLAAVATSDPAGDDDFLSEQRKGSTATSIISSSSSSSSSNAEMNNNNAYGKLHKAAVEAYNSLVAYGSSLDLSLVSNDYEIVDVVVGDDTAAFTMNKRRCEKLEKIGRDLWKIIRANPDLFIDDIIARASPSSVEQQKRYRAIAGGYIRTIAVRLIFLRYIDTRCTTECPPILHDLTQQHCHRDGGNNKAQQHNSPSPKELVFGLKVLSKGGLAILHHEKNARASHDTLTLAISCFNLLSDMAQHGDGEAANELKDVLDEAFDVYSALPDSASLFEAKQKDGDASTQADIVNVDWPTILLKHLALAENFIHKHYDAALKDECKSARMYTALQRFIPQLARLCLKHGSHFAEIGMNDHAMKALNIDLRATNASLLVIKELKAHTYQKKEDHMLQKLEADLVLVSIESFYVLSAVLQTLGMKQDAIGCLDQVEKYLTERHKRDEELYVDAMNALGNDKDFVFSEESVIESPKAQDKADIRNRADTALTKGRQTQTREKATLSSRRIKLFNDNPSSQEDERCIDDELHSMIELVPKKQEISLVEKKFENEQILKMTLQAIRSVYVRRKMLGTSNEGNVALFDPYRLMFDRLATSHQLRPFVLLDKISATLSIAFEVRRRKLESEYESIDQEAIILADEYISSFKRDSAVKIDTTLFVDAKNSMKTELFEETKVQFGRAVSLYHSFDAYEICSKWASLLKDVLESRKLSSEHEDPNLAEVLSILAYSLSMSGNHACGMKMAREAWKKQKCVNNLVILFHCATTYEHADTLLEFDNALNELSTLDHDNILEHFPRLSNSCVENEAEGGGELLLGVQERWMNLLLSSKKLSVCLEQKGVCESPPVYNSMLDVLCAYLQNFELVVSSHNDRQKTESMCEYLSRIIDGCLKLLQKCRDRKQEKLIDKRGKKKKALNETRDEGVEFDLIWNDTTTQTLLGERSQVVWVAESLWNIGNQLMAASVLENVTYDSRTLAADLFAASHDFILMSEEEEGSRLSKLDYDVKYNPEKFTVPSFTGSSTTASEISSEFSAQCLLLSAAVCVDYVFTQAQVGGRNDMKILLRRSLHRLAQSQQEFELNGKKGTKVSRMIALLTMRCIIGIGEDSFAFKVCNDGLSATILNLHLNDMSASDKAFPTLRQVKSMSDLALQNSMSHADRALTKLLVEMLQKVTTCSGTSIVDLGGGYLLSLGDLQKKTIQSASTVDETIGLFQEIDDFIKCEGKNKLYTADEFSWFAIESHNRGVQLLAIGENEKAKIFFTFAIGLVKFATKEVRCFEQQMLTAFTTSVQNRNSFYEVF